MADASSTRPQRDHDSAWVLLIGADRRTVVVFEPTAAEFTLEAHDRISVAWVGGSDPGSISLEAGDLVVWTPAGGYTRAWQSDGTEVHVGPESGPDAR